ncbi:MAG TPA: carboxypeptidase regulatory-like domain-containing protein, partial [Candidatus Marinimicrobia bacterium]|nr:carboxypeptidase regulatory-like domain-containing protein [Candidatus Neomarinimicrobiota bacterium]
GSGTITGSVQMDNGSPLSGVSLSDELWGSTVATTTSDSDGDFSQTSLALGRHSVTYSKSGYFGLTSSELLETDGQTLNLETVRMLPDNCTSGTMSGTITNAVTGDNMSGVHQHVITGMNKVYRSDNWRQWSSFGYTDSIGAWSLSKDAGWYTIMSHVSGYYWGYNNVYSCGNQPKQNNSLRKELNEGEMSILLKWPITSPVTGTDLDSHLQIPDNASNKFHVYYSNSKKTFYYATNTNTCGSCSSDQLSDNVSLDKDHNPSSPSATPSYPATPPGDETITISKVRSGTYSFSVHNLTNSDNSSNYKTNLAQSRAKVRVIYCPVGTDCSDQEAVIEKKFHPPNDNGTLWRVFTFSTSGSGSGFTRLRTMSYESQPADVY